MPFVSISEEIGGKKVLVDEFYDANKEKNDPFNKMDTHKWQLVSQFIPYESLWNRPQ